MITPLKTNILIEIEEIKEINGIVLPDSRNNIHEKAKVLAIGEDVTKIKKGDTVLYKSWALDTVVIGAGEKEKKYSFIKESDILAKQLVI